MYVHTYTIHMHMHIHIHIHIHVHIESVQARACVRAYLRAIQAPIIMHELSDEFDVVDLRREFRRLLGNIFRLPLPKFDCQHFDAMPQPPTSTKSTVSALCIVEIHGNIN